MVIGHIRLTSEFTPTGAAAQERTCPHQQGGDEAEASPLAEHAWGGRCSSFFWALNGNDTRLLGLSYYFKLFSWFLA